MSVKQSETRYNLTNIRSLKAATFCSFVHKHTPLLSDVEMLADDVTSKQNVKTPIASNTLENMTLSLMFINH